MVRYYLPFDENSILINFFTSKIASKEIIILDKVVTESMYAAKGIVIKSMGFLKERKIQVNTTGLFPSDTFFNQLDSDFVNQVIKDGLTEVQFESEKQKFLNSADAKLILFTLDYKTRYPDDNLIIISEETDISNDKKPFKKLPSICNILDLEIYTLPKYLSNIGGIDLEFH